MSLDIINWIYIGRFGEEEREKMNKNNSNWENETIEWEELWEKTFESLIREREW